ncbi:putative YgeY family selenium metabolism-linked hydrolase [Paratrimastix pyriformis]|uniref:YgeY family selenium metabolism-linked hydrolase n=1 Tax=Paratrimastix pyriformis TaxID=342808 RepID=A0ABQ8UGZ3_9EUKA|nr:putative YgeY family selenium metabolism-linked hydrolase [Paratrimastix pyriformis]|eukprot:GAFH01001308.1.p1 GENE.GAFH01001308.1~~GAFH01001308.1.p1  ORF type:complete len:520 (+),score=211.46 GAFH01001308.1:27-1586(+)
MSLDAEIMRLAHQYKGLAREILAEAVRIPADYVNKPVSEGGDPRCGTSNHEEPRLRYLREMCIRHHAVEDPADVFFDDFGSIVFTVQDKSDGIPAAQKKVIYFDGHTDTVNPLRQAWRDKIGGGIDCYDGLTDPTKVDRAFLDSQLGYLAPQSEWNECLFGRGTADQLAGVVGEIVACKIMLETKHLGSLRGVIIRAYGTVAEEDNDGGAPRYVVNHVLPGAGPEIVPDVVIHTEGTGCSKQGALGIYRGQRGRMQIEVDVVGKSCHGSMPWMGVNPLEYGARIIAEANDMYNRREAILDDAFLGHGTRVTSDCSLDTPSDCAVPERFRFRFDRRITAGELPEQCVRDIDTLPSVAAARAAGCKVTVSVPLYDTPTWKGAHPNNPQIYASWVTPAEHPAIRAAVAAYKNVVTPAIPAGHVEAPHSIHREPRVSRWIFSTDGVGYPIPVDNKTINVPETKKWVTTGAFKHPAMFGFGAGYEQNTHKIGEWVDCREIEHCLALYARFPSLYVETCAHEEHH